MVFDFRVLRVIYFSQNRNDSSMKGVATVSVFVCSSILNMLAVICSYSAVAGMLN